MTDKKEPAKKATADEKIAAIVAVLKANGLTLPKELDE